MELVSRRVLATRAIKILWVTSFPSTAMVLEGVGLMLSWVKDSVGSSSVNLLRGGLLLR